MFRQAQPHHDDFVVAVKRHGGVAARLQTIFLCGSELRRSAVAAKRGNVVIAQQSSGLAASRPKGVKA